MQCHLDEGIRADFALLDKALAVRVEHHHVQVNVLDELTSSGQALLDHLFALVINVPAQTHGIWRLEWRITATMAVFFVADNITIQYALLTQ